ncbi:MAG: hypothetical protein II946_01325, partial [Kiritimatiellae bacterium]|nr:hypothetical protein [Kiritimatiellia bacterium]
MNISLNEFRRLSMGEHNAGEVKLAGETKFTKMNNHVGSFFVNKDIIIGGGVPVVVDVGGRCIVSSCVSSF